MRAITYERYGGPEVLTVREVRRPVASADELQIRVEAAEATKTDCEIRSFNHAVKWFKLPLRLFVGVRRPRLPILGMYFAGTVEEVGSDVTGFVVGDAVYGTTGMRRGAYGQFVTVPAKAVITTKPTTMTFADAAAVPLGAFNALHFMRLTDVQPGESVLVNGAGGVIGAYGVQIAHMMGATVTGVDAGHKEDFVRSMGATDFVDYQTQDVTTLADRFDVILDMVPSGSLQAKLQLLRPNGRYAHGNPTLATMVRAPFLSRRTGRKVYVRFADEKRTTLRELAVMVDGGKLRSIVDRVLPMDEAQQAHRLVDTEQRIGAIVLAIGDRAHEH